MKDPDNTLARDLEAIAKYHATHPADQRAQQPHDPATDQVNTTPDLSHPTCSKIPASTPHMCDLEVSEVREKINKLLNSALHRPLTRTEHQVVIESIAAILHQQDQEFIKTLLSQDRLRLTQEIDGKMEQWAAIEHDRWSKWQKHMHSKILPSADDGISIIGTEWIERWSRQIDTPYAELSETEKESDREQVRPYIEDIKALINNHSEV